MSLATAIADVFTELETPAEVAADLGNSDWAMAAEIAALRLGRDWDATGWRALPGEVMRARVVRLLQERQPRPTCRRAS